MNTTLAELKAELKDGLTIDDKKHFETCIRSVLRKVEKALEKLASEAVVPKVPSEEEIVKVMRDLEELNDWRMTESDPNWHKAVAVRQFLLAKGSRE